MLSLRLAAFGALTALNSASLRMIQYHPVLVVPGRMQASFFRFHVMDLHRAVTSAALVGLALTV